jgi:hypothetical protein
MAKTPPDIADIPLDRGEFTEVLLRGVLRDPDGVGRLTALAERFLGQVLTGRRWILLTNKRLLLLRARNPKRYREGEWFDVAFDRRNLRPGEPVTTGRMVVLPLTTQLGLRTVLVPDRSYKESLRLARALGLPEPRRRH